jgi:pyruvate kinase
MIRRLMIAGVDVFRHNFSHGTQAEHGDRIRRVRAISREVGVEPGVLLDLQGPKIRLGLFQNGTVILEPGSRFTITVEPVPGTSEVASTTYPNFARDVKPGNRVLLADGNVELRALESNGVSVVFEVVAGGQVGDRQGINLPDVKVSSPALTPKDISDLEFGLDVGVDFVALSFVRTPEDLRALRQRLQHHPDPPPVIAKIEKPEAWENLDGILQEAEGVMVARGDLGVEMDLEKVPHIQKSIIERARLHGKFVITATQMLESMVHNPTPTRAEVSDVANAIYDGTDAVMLSAETSVGRFPVEAVRMMVRIAKEIEGALRERGFPALPRTDAPADPEILAQAAHHAACTAGVAAIAVFTMSGSSARLVARSRPHVPLYAFTPSESTARRLSAVYGARPMRVKGLQSTDEMLEYVERMLLERGLVEQGGKLVFVAGQPLGRPGLTNLMKLHRVGERS